MKRLLFICTLTLLLICMLASCSNGVFAECQHNFGEWETVKQASCKNKGELTRVCNICNTTETSFVQESNHTPVTDEAVAATCNTTGLTQGSHCSVCGEVIVAQIIVPKNDSHLTVTDKAVAATCNTTGLTQGSHCSVCNEVIVAQTILPVTSHSYKDGICTMCKKNQASDFAPDYASGQANTIGTDKASSNYTSQTDWIYFVSSATKISKFKKTSTSSTTVYEVANGFVRCINVVGDWIYFYVEGENTASSYIAKVGTDGSSFEKILTSVTVGEMLVIKETIFFTTIKNPYNDYAKDCAPLYMISVNGGVSKQLHDGYVLSMTADDKYLYFLHIQKSGSSTIYKIKHDGTGKNALLTKANKYNLNYIVLADSKLYFMVKDPYSDEDEYIFSSISVNGGSYTTYGKTYYTESFSVKGNTAYYIGTPHGNYESYGVVKYDFETNTHSLTQSLLRNSATYECRMLLNCLLVENYKNPNQDLTLKSISVYNLYNKTWCNITVK